MSTATDTIDLDAYFRRIGYTGPREPTLAVLTALHRQHPEAITFENLNPLLGLPVALEPSALEAKLVHAGRGGYCFEHNLLFGHVLRALDFEVDDLAARVVWNQAEDAITARSHMLLRVTLDDTPYLVDVGFGGMTQTVPLHMTAGVEQTTTHEPFRLVARGDALLVQARVDGTWRGLYRFDLQPQHLVDYQVTNWYLSNHPESHFVTGLIAARPEPGRRYTLRNNELAIHHLDGGSERERLTSAAALREVLETQFRIRLPETDALAATLERIAAMR